MPREKKYTKTIAVRITAEEWELITFSMSRDGFKNPSTFLRYELDNTFAALRESLSQANKRREAAERRAAKKAADVNG